MPFAEKKRRTQDVNVKPLRKSRIFAPFRSIGYVSNQIPFDIEVRGTHFLVTTCVGNSFQTYDCERLNLLFVGKQLEREISCLKSYKDFMLAGSGSKIFAYKRGKIVWEIELESSADEILHLDAFGEWIIAISSTRHVHIWKHVSKYEVPELHTIFQPTANADITALIHPSTYLNKVVLGFSDGSLQLWNMRTAKCIHKFDGLRGDAITSLSQAPVLDVLAIGAANGRILLYNLRKAVTLMEFRQSGRVLSSSFRTDGVPILATSNHQGDISFYDLSKRRVQNVVYGAHHGPIPKLQFLNGQPLLVTTGPDNSLKEWIFDSMDGVPRVLRFRNGHYEPPSYIQFYGQNVHFLLSAATDNTLRAISLFQDNQTVELSQGSVTSKAKKLNARPDELKLPEIVSMSSSNTREKYWDNILTAHKNDNAARTWSWKNKTLGQHVLPTTDGTPVRAVCVSCCGNFGMVGSSKGLVNVYNMQSGILRKSFGREQQSTKPITSIMLDNVNRVLVTSSLDGNLRFWDFNKGSLIDTVDMGSSITNAIYHHTSDLIAIICDDFGVRIVDVQTRKIVRELWGHSNRLTDLDFSNDGRWLVTSSLDGTIRTWDLPTGHLIDAITTGSVCTGLAFGPTGDYLATSHVDQIGISLWTNLSMFKHVSTKSLRLDDVTEVSLPSISGERGTSVVQAALNVEEEEVEEDDILHTTADQLDGQLQTLSKLPRTQWQTLVNMELIKARNAPKEAPKAPEKAPFFLPSLKEQAEGLVSKANETNNDDQQRPKLASSVQTVTTRFSELLHGGDGDAFFEYLKTLPPAKTDLEIRSLEAYPPYEEFILFIKSMTSRLASRRDFELVQAYMAVFIKAHEDVLLSSDSPEEKENVLNALKAWDDVQKEENRRLLDLVHYCSGVLSFMRT
ncbi:U3 snoRNP-associated protein Utp21 [Schizosaccharomyces cryophilus OY26]|uniref:U3 snoRNP-associated protein Utp21 n=1 Tax=Schizosaccharomyces cryophilus (strain OY26 / ATCC MYA-4695 / CBS 11777 / NBRC 106824 / NRRL Y48691) TaxID=653667 RepID=S9X845_SCHCR|nr:U3 snoRNP-associated protein Utp21 [Schizosaccharomyces cryophilus OY26]EPY49916.1 U3 snoRNP-associated protein Utp21 [Schizosaccharomyces cryophilus OY26]